MDMRMPVIDGYEASRQIRNFNKDIPIIAQTACATQKDRDLCLGAGCNDYLAKPLRINLVLDKIQGYLS